MGAEVHANDKWRPNAYNMRSGNRIGPARATAARDVRAHTTPRGTSARRRSNDGASTTTLERIIVDSDRASSVSRVRARVASTRPIERAEAALSRTSRGDDARARDDGLDLSIALGRVVSSTSARARAWDARTRTASRQGRRGGRAARREEATRWRVRARARARIGRRADWRR